MGTVLVARGEDVVFSKGYGEANVEWSLANTPSTKFRLGSITKQFTAASILLLEERGKLRIADPVKTHLTDAPAAWDGITVHHLLTHTSGIPNFTAAPDYRASMASPTTAEQTIARFRDKPLDFVPGSKMSYSNSGYIVLGAIIEKISGTSYAAFLDENIFKPIGMKDSGYDSNTAIIPRRASGYVSGPGGPNNAPFLHMTIPFSAGALYLDHRRSAALEPGVVWGEAPLRDLAGEDDDTCHEQLRIGPHRQDHRRTQGRSAQRRHQRLQHVPVLLP